MNRVMAHRLPLSWLMAFSCVLLLGALISSISLGAMPITFSDSFIALLPIKSEIPEYVSVIIQQVRLPRTLLAIAIGGILALCGAVMQGLFRNSLADPGIIGVSAGASLGAAIAIVVFGSVLEHTAFLLFGTVPLFSFLGGALATFAVYYMGTSRNGTSVNIMLLAGVALGSIAGAGMGLLNYFADDEALRSLSLWTMGSLAGASWEALALAYSTLIFLACAFQFYAKPLNALLLGESEARHLGVNVQKLKRNLILLTAAGVGVTVALSGIIGFIGLVVPHIGRMLSGPDHRRLLPLSWVLGSLLLLISDMVARTVVSPLELPVGIITAIIGAPFFLGLLLKQRGRLA